MNLNNILIIGGTGSWGRELASQLYPIPGVQLYIMARNEPNIVAMSREFPGAIFKVGDIRSCSSVFNAMENINTVFHLAALKHVPICEAQPIEAIDINITGSLNVVNACKARGITEAILISTDKAVEAVNTYGISKAMAEKLFLSQNFKVIRAGNVLGSSGSVVPLFKQQIKEKIPCTITDLRMTRFFMTLKQAISLVLKSYKVAKGGEIAVINMPSFLLSDVIKVLAGQDNYPTIEIGIREGEKLHEVLLSEAELLNTRYSAEDDLYIISPSYKASTLVPQVSSKNICQDLECLSTLLQEMEN